IRELCIARKVNEFRQILVWFLTNFYTDFTVAHYNSANVRQLPPEGAPAMNHLLVKLRSRLQAFRSARGGNVAVIFGVAIIPIVGAVGAAVDYSRANSAKTDMQAALDSTALKLAKDGAATLSSTALQSSATSYFNAIFHRPEAQNAAVTPTISGSTLTVSG